MEWIIIKYWHNNYVHSFFNKGFSVKNKQTIQKQKVLINNKYVFTIDPSTKRDESNSMFVFIWSNWTWTLSEEMFWRWLKNNDKYIRKQLKEQMKLIKLRELFWLLPWPYSHPTLPYPTPHPIPTFSRRDWIMHATNQRILSHLNEIRCLARTIHGYDGVSFQSLPFPPPL